LDTIRKRIDADFSSHLSAIQEGLRIETTVTNRDACRRFCSRLVGEIEALGGEASIEEPGDLPAVFGRIDAGAPRTLLVYRNYDLIPADPTPWKVPPYSASVLDMEGVGEAVVGRGAAEPKGPLLAFLQALAAIKAAGEALPVNLLFLIEGDDQLGSPALPELVENRRTELGTADAVWIPKFSQSYSGVPVIPLGFKGLLVLELICAGGRWGGPSGVSLHSGNAAWIASPVWRLVQALASLTTEDEEVTVEGFYDDVVHPIDRSAPEHFSVAGEMTAYLRENHVTRFKQDLPDEALFRRYLMSPTFNLSNLLVRPSSFWSHLVLPSEARAWIDIRLVPDMDPERVLQRIREHLEIMDYSDIEVIPHLAYRPWRIEADNPLVRAWTEVYRGFGLEPEHHPLSGTSQRLRIFRDELDLPVVVGGLGTCGKAYHDNEYAVVAGIRLFEKSVAEFLDRFGREGSETQ
jgi:acetylornithine deacetylase/succinyl-diaminopimelate desuccinylase-like protein